jgi:hypothetical protein
MNRRPLWFVVALLAATAAVAAPRYVPPAPSPWATKNPAAAKPAPVVQPTQRQQVIAYLNEIAVLHGKLQQGDAKVLAFTPMPQAGTYGLVGDDRYPPPPQRRDPVFVDTRVVQAYCERAAIQIAVYEEFGRVCGPLAAACPPVRVLHAHYEAYLKPVADGARRFLKGPGRPLVQADLAVSGPTREDAYAARDRANREAWNVRVLFDLPRTPTPP